jgi:hypothetical protein
MSDHIPGEPGQDDAALAPELAQLDQLLLAEGRRWRRHEPSTARLERHLRALVQIDGAGQRNEDVMLTEHEPAYDRTTPQPTPRRAPPRWRGPLAVVATVLLVAMAASVFAFLSARGMGTGTGQHTAKATSTPAVTRVTAIQPPNTFLPMPANAYLSDISLSSAHDGWAVGGIRIPDLAGQNFSAAQGVLVHYHDGIWTAARDSFPNIGLDGVSMLSASEGWAVGQVDNITGTDRYTGAVLLHFTSGHWRTVSTPTLATLHPRAIHMFAPSSGYIVGVTNVPSTAAPGSVDQRVAIAIYQNGAWGLITTPFDFPNSQVVMVSASEGWASALEDLTKPGGVENQQATIYHYLNGVWTKALAFPGYVTSLSAASPADVWALAVQCVNCTEPKPRIERYNGTAWEQMSPPDQASFPSLPRTQAGELIGQSIFDGASSGVWISYVTQNTTITTIKNVYATWTWKKKPSGDGWQIVNPQVLGGEVIALAADSNGGVWALAQAGNPPMNSPLTMTILYTQGSSWKVYGRSR